MQPRVAAATFSTQPELLSDLWYRATGSVADEDVLMRDSLIHSAHPVRTAATLAIEVLRQRKRRHYIGAWLPALIETGNATSAGPRPHVTTGARYDMVESGSVAFLKALEGLEPRERLVFVMCDALGFDLQEAASTLELGAATARTLLQRGRRKMHHYDATNAAPTVEVQRQVAELLRDCLTHFQSRDASRLEKLLAPDAQAMFDSGGEFVAPTGVVSGSNAAAKLLTKFAYGLGPVIFGFRMLNGLPAALGESKGRPKWAKQLVLRLDARDGHICEVHVIMATAKLAAVRFDTL